MVSTTTVPFAGAVHDHHRVAPQVLKPLPVGSPDSVVAPTFDPRTLMDGPCKVMRLAKLSLASGSWTPRIVFVSVALCLPKLSVATAWMRWSPRVSVVTRTEYGAESSTPTVVPSRKNSTRLTVTGALTATAAARVSPALVAELCPLVGLVRVTTRGFSTIAFRLVVDTACCIGAALSVTSAEQA
jgi:hypothetical protein